VRDASGDAMEADSPRVTVHKECELFVKKEYFKFNCAHFVVHAVSPREHHRSRS
jgi:uncharacterized protein YutD